MAKLTHAEVVAAKPQSKRYRLFDGSGLILDITPKGAKGWLLSYRHPISRKKKTTALGKYPELTLKDAREKASEYRRMIEQGTDPMEYRESLVLQQKEQEELAQAEANRAALTLRKVSIDWLNVKSSQVSADFLTDIERSLELHVWPCIGETPIDELEAPGVIEALKPLEAAGKLETVKRVTGRLNEIMTYAVNTGLVHHNPLTGIRSGFQKPNPQNLPSIEPAELPELLADIQKASIRISTRNLLLFHLHTAVRPAEVSGARWDEVDMKAGLWRIPAERMKKKRGHTVPLTEVALKILERQQKLSGHLEHIFPGDRDQASPTHTQTGSMALKRMGYGGRLVSHGFRSIFSTFAHDDTRGFDYHAIEACLAHVPDAKTALAYNRGERLNKRREIMEAWSAFISQCQVKAMAKEAGLSVVEV